MVHSRKASMVILLILMFAVVSLSAYNNFAFAQGELETYVESLDQAKEGMTLWELIKQGGIVMVVLGVLSVIAGAIIIYNFITLQVKKLAPADFTEELIQKLENRKIGPAKAMCEPQRNIISAIVMEGLNKKKRGVLFAREAMENRARKEISSLWQSISYLADIATIAPLLGLLGTVFGMIQAFNVIAFQTAVVKPILLAGGISKAMITTAGGLVVAIPIMLFYSYFRGKVQDITNIVETYTTDIMKLIEEVGE